jgi:hypothetical protein
MPFLTGQVLNNCCRIDKLLGQAGFGAVYRAWDKNMGCPRALKENLDISPEAARDIEASAARWMDNRGRMIISEVYLRIDPYCLHIVEANQYNVG